MLNLSKTLYTPHPITVLNYQKMAETGILNHDARVELIEGEIIDMAPIGSKHASIVNRLTKELVNAVGNSAIISAQNPVILGNLSEPEPDFALLKPKANNYEDSLPKEEDILLLIEIADTTINYDRQIKAPLYANFSIPEYWLFDIQKKEVVVFQKPEQGQYLEVKKHLLPVKLSPILLLNINIELS